MTVSENPADRAWREERLHSAAYLEARMNDLDFDSLPDDEITSGIRRGYELAIEVLEGKA